MEKCSILHVLLLLSYIYIFIYIFQSINIVSGANEISSLNIFGNLNQKQILTEPALETMDSKTKNDMRRNRQFFIDPSNSITLQNFGTGDNNCVTKFGQVRTCIDQRKCHQMENIRLKRQSDFYSTQWAQQLFLLDREACSLLDIFGRKKSGVCCIETLPNRNSPILFSHLSSPFLLPDNVRPILPPPVAWQQPSRDDKITEVIENLILTPANGNNREHTKGPSETTVGLTDQNLVPYDPFKEVVNSSAVTYDDYRYGWPTQSAAQFAGFYGISQWPPPVPTHPPSSNSWPPPLPTHPPGHHYPTHPPLPGPVTRPTTTGPMTIATTTQAFTTFHPMTTRRSSTTTKRPFYPSYPSFSGYPNYPTYPAYTTQKTMTTRKPSEGNTGATENILPSKCGMKNTISPDQERIVGGTNASPHELPWMAVLFKSGKQFCGGSLITKNHILTAAHCVARMTTWDVAALTAHLGDYNIRTDYEVKHVSRRIKRLVRHKGFDFSHLHNDIAILTLSEPVRFSYEIQPICLPTTPTQQGRSYSGQVATVAGWGSLRENGPQPSILQKVQIPIWSNSECARKYGPAAPGGIIESMLCAGQVARDSCSGDSGGPMIVKEMGRYVQVGIVSWGIGCGKGQYPGVYTRVTSLLSWIYKNIK